MFTARLTTNKIMKWYKSIKHDGIRGRLIMLHNMYGDDPIYKVYLIKSKQSFNVNPNDKYKRLLEYIDWIDVEIINRDRPGHSHVMSALKRGNVEFIPIVDSDGKFYAPYQEHFYQLGEAHRKYCEGYVYVTALGMFKYKNYIKLKFKLLNQTTTLTDLTILEAIRLDRNDGKVYRIRMVGCKGNDNYVPSEFYAKCRLNPEGDPEEIYAYPGSIYLT